jgi:hypothetical protein
MATLPTVLRLAQFIERRVVDLQQAALFQVGRGDAPAAFQVPIKPIAEDVAKRFVRFSLLSKLNARLAGIEFEGQREGFEYLLGEFVV